MDTYCIIKMQEKKKCPNSLEVYPTKSQCPDSMFATCRTASAKRYSRSKTDRDFVFDHEYLTNAVLLK